jgi:hypothetical protein
MRLMKLGMALAATAALLCGAPAMAASQIDELSIFNYVTTNNCAATDDFSCSPLGVTAAGTTAPLLINANNRDIALGKGSYYIYGNPWAGTDFMVQGAPMIFGFEIKDNSGYFQTISNVLTVPDLSIAGLLLYQGYGITLSTTGITTADLVGFGSTSAAFKPDGRSDFVLRLDFGVSPPAVPEPATWAMMIVGFGLLGGAMRRRIPLAKLA